MRTLKRLVLFTEILLCLAWARFLVRFVAFSRWRHLLGPIDAPPDTPEQLDAARTRHARNIGRRIDQVAGRVPFQAVCLPRAMAGRWILARRGIPSHVVLGSRRGDADEADMMFHAWLVAGDTVVTGAGQLERYGAFAKKRTGDNAA